MRLPKYVVLKQEETLRCRKEGRRVRLARKEGCKGLKEPLVRSHSPKDLSENSRGVGQGTRHKFVHAGILVHACSYTYT